MLKTWSPPVLWSITIYYFSSLPGSAIHLPPIESIDKVIHILVFAVLNLLVQRGCGKTGGGKRAFRWGVLYSVAYGLVDEIHQYFVPGRFADPFDFAADVLGVVLSSWIYLRYLKTAKRGLRDAKI